MRDREFRKTLTPALTLTAHSSGRRRPARFVDGEGGLALGERQSWSSNPDTPGPKPSGGRGT